MWNAAFDGQLAELESLFAATRDSIQFLKAAKERGITPHFALLCVRPRLQRL